MARHPRRRRNFVLAILTLRGRQSWSVVVLQHCKGGFAWRRAPWVPDGGFHPPPPPWASPPAVPPCMWLPVVSVIKVLVQQKAVLRQQ